MASSMYGNANVFGGTSALGLGFEAAGMFESIQGADAYNKAAQQQIAGEEKVQTLHEQFMELDNRRKQLENLRNTQKARAQAIAGGASSGASFGSGVAGGTGQVMGHGAFGAEGLSQSLGIGRGIFKQDIAIDQARIAEASAQSQMQLGSGLSSFGSSMMSAAGPLSMLV